jgi:hypothetical protein
LSNTKKPPKQFLVEIGIARMRFQPATQ